jgi:hypothetical protein
MGEAALRDDENVTDALVVSFPMIVGHKFSNGCPQGALRIPGKVNAIPGSR